ncbi:ABC transporter ATP-binding protein [Corynebacterium casei]|uniref:ABC transporter ATP-binding protein n=1 Tax=Corynebacterium casei TaxID=160386 RepID=UPI003F925039
MSMRGGGGPRGARVSKADHEAQREINRQAPKIKNLGSRIFTLFKPYRAQISILIVMVLLSAALGIIPPLITQRVFDDGLFPETGGPNMPVVLQLVGLMLGIFIITQIISVAQAYYTARVGNRVMGDLRIQLFAHLQSMELAFFTRTKTGVIQSRLQNDVGGVAGVLSNTVSSVIGNTVTVISAFIAMVLLSWQLTIIAFIVLPFLVWGQRRVGQIRAKIAGQAQESLSEMSAITQETLSVSGVLLAKTYSRQSSEIERYSDENAHQITLQVHQAMSGQLFFGVVNIFMSAVPAVVYLVSGWLLSAGSSGSFAFGEAGITAGTIVAFTTVQSRLLFPMMGLMRVALDLQTSSALFARIFEYLDMKPAIVDAPDAKSPSDEPGKAGHIQFDNVSFRYEDASAESRPTLDRVSFDIEPGQFVAFVGASGSGKTTIGNLVPRLYDASSGTVSYAGDDVRDLKLEELMKHIGVVTQEPYLFHASIAENLRYGKPGATQEEIEKAARLANIHDTITSFETGYDTVVGERGYRLSGGEKQRIAIARVLLKNPRVLVLDEATSALDTVNERAVQHALDTAAEGRTTIAIAHRLSTIEGADRIYVVDRGQIIESGTHEELLDKAGAYAQLYSQQAT